MPRAEPTDRGPAPVIEGEVVEELDPIPAPPDAPATPALSPVRALAPSSPVVLPAVQAAAAAATGFVAGAATLALVRRRGGRRVSRGRGSRRPADGLPIVGSRSFLVDVHLIAKPGE